MAKLDVLDSGGPGIADIGETLAVRAPVADDRDQRITAVTLAAAAHAAEVDRDSRFPAEAIAAAREARLLGIAVPRELGGESATITEVAEVAYRLGQACSSTAMIYAMHQTKVACLVRHGGVWHQRFLRRLAGEQLLLASSTTEGQNGGNIRSSAAAVEREGTEISLDRAATVISYGAQADGIVTTARRGTGATSGDQVLVAFVRDHYTLTPTVAWDTLGMRGTCSAGFALKASGDAAQILPEPYDRIHSQTMTPVAHLTWSSVWAGIAAAAVTRAQGFIRKAARNAGGTLPPGAAHYTRATASLRLLRSQITAMLRRYEALADNPRGLATLEFQAAINLLKVDSSELAVSTVMSALRACGLSGYRNDGEASISRLLRDILSSPVMINNDRILSNIATASLMSAVPQSLSD